MASEVLARLDIGVLALCCSCYAGWLEAITVVHPLGAMIKSPNGHPIRSPHVAIANWNALSVLSDDAKLFLLRR